jgi:hypothetical protein
LPALHMFLLPFFFYIAPVLPTKSCEDVFGVYQTAASNTRRVSTYCFSCLK